MGSIAGNGLACIWALIPLYNIYNFATCPIERLVDEGKGMGIRGLFRVPMFWVAVILMVCAGASELSMAQWASAYAESAIGLSKTVGDLAGPCMFAVTMGVSRVIYGKYGDRMNLMSFMMGSGLLCLVCYGMASLSSDPVIGLVGCIVCGFSVGIMWPGTISISSSRLPFGGTAMFAMLAMAGDLGGAFGPSLVGNITEAANDNLQAGMLAGSVFPLVLLISLLLLKGLQTVFVIFCEPAYHHCTGQKTDQVGKDHQPVKHIGHIPYQIHFQGGTSDHKKDYQNRIDLYCFIAKEMAHIYLPEIIPAYDGGKGEEEHTDGYKNLSERTVCRVKGTLGQGGSGQSIVPHTG